MGYRAFLSCYKIGVIWFSLSLLTITSFFIAVWAYEPLMLLSLLTTITCSIYRWWESRWLPKLRVTSPPPNSEIEAGSHYVDNFFNSTIMVVVDIIIYIFFLWPIMEFFIQAKFLIIASLEWDGEIFRNRRGLWPNEQL